MAANRLGFIVLIILFFLGLATPIYFFGKEELRNIYNNIVSPSDSTQDPSPITGNTLYESFISAPIAWDTQMKELTEEGFSGKPFIADIFSADFTTKVLSLDFDLNYGGEFPQIQRIVAKANCAVDKSYILSLMSLEKIAEKIDIFSFADIRDEEPDDPYIRPGDLILSYCQDDFCSKFGEECILVRIETENEP